MLNFSSLDNAQVNEILHQTKSGVWTIEIENNKEPRMFVNTSMAELLCITEELTPEETYKAWYRGVREEYAGLINNTISRVVNGKQSEAIYRWLTPSGDEYSARCGAINKTDSENCIILWGYHQDITSTFLAFQEQLDFADVPTLLASDYYSIYSLNFRTKEIALHQSTDSILQGYQPKNSTSFDVWFDDLINLVEKKDKKLFKIFNDLEKLRKELNKNHKKTIIFSKSCNNTFRHTEIKLIPIEYDGNEVVRCFLVEKDVDDVISKERENLALLQDALNRVERTQNALSTFIYDRLTGLYSKEYFYDKAKELLQKNLEKEYIFLALDIEDFKAFNSIAGIKEGDRLIKYVASILDTLLKNSPILYGRSNADAFIVMMENNPHKVSYFEENVLQTIEEYEFDIPIKLIFGEYVIKNKDEEIALIHDKAVLASKTCKGKFGKNIARYTKEMEESVNLQRTLSQDMEYAITAGEFEVYFQPKYDVQTLKICGAEALVRWNHRKEKLISPALFIPLFEQNGFIRNLDYYVWEHCCKFIKSNNIEIPLSINVSRANMFSSDLQERILHLLEKYNMVPKQLYLEFTESLYYNDTGNMQKILTQMQEQGLILSMDDFGTGYSSLSMLKNVTVHELKIDASFVDFNQDDEKALLILETIVTMSKKLQLQVTVEGVETKEQLEIIKNLGCDTVQGYYLARPMPEQNFLELLEKEKNT